MPKSAESLYHYVIIKCEEMSFMVGFTYVQYVLSTVTSHAHKYHDSIFMYDHVWYYYSFYALKKKKNVVLLNYLVKWFQHVYQYILTLPAHFTNTDRRLLTIILAAIIVV